MVECIGQAGIETQNRLKFSGYSTDTKPIGTYANQTIGDMSMFFEKDTQKWFFYDQTAETWDEYGGV
jgi:hypothetical protein